MTLSDFSIESLKELITGDSKLTPKLTGPQLVKHFSNFGIRDVYSWDNGGLPDSMSRNEYAARRMRDLNGTKELKKLIESVVDSRHFISSPSLEFGKAVDAVNNVIKHDGCRLESVDGIYKVVGAPEPDTLEVQVHFEDIQQQIIEEVKKAQFIVWIAVAWFTDPKLFKLLKEKKGSGINVQVIIINDEINAKAKLDFENHFETYRVDKKGFFQNIMHHKFCIVDLKTVIHGSYNWTVKAQYNRESISIDTSRELAEKYAAQFIELKE